VLVALLGPWRYLLYAGVVVAFIGGLVYAKNQYDEKQQAIGAAPYILAIAEQKQKAAILLAAETEKAASITKKWQDYARNSDAEYEKKIAAIRAAANVGGGLRLIDPERWDSRTCAPADKGDTGTSKDATASREFLGELESFLRAEASRADEIAAYAMSCYRFVNGL